MSSCDTSLWWFLVNVSIIIKFRLNVIKFFKFLVNIDTIFPEKRDLLLLFICLQIFLRVCLYFSTWLYNISWWIARVLFHFIEKILIFFYNSSKIVIFFRYYLYIFIYFTVIFRKLNDFLEKTFTLLENLSREKLFSGNVW